MEGDNTPLGNTILYSVDTGASAEIKALTAQIGPDKNSGCAAAMRWPSQSVGPKNPPAQEQPP
jgi:hypothetical protein